MVFISSSCFRYNIYHHGCAINEKVTPIWNVMGVVPGHIKDEVIIVGVHRDGSLLKSFFDSVALIPSLSMGMLFDRNMDKNMNIV